MFQQQEPGNPSRNIQDKERRTRRNQKRKKSTPKVKNGADVEAESAEKDQEELVEITSSQRQTQANTDPATKEKLKEGVNTAEKQQRDGQVKMVESQTQTRKQKGKNKFTQTSVALQDQGTQTDEIMPQQDDAKHEKLQLGPESPDEAQLTEDKRAPEPEPNNTVQTPPQQNKSAVKDEPSPEPKLQKENDQKDAGGSGSTTTSAAEKSVKPSSYAEIVSGGENQSGAAASRAWQSPR